MPDTLKRVWQSAICNEYRKLAEPKAANIPVIVVPMLEPNVRGKTLSNETRPRPTKGTSVEVNTELLWTMIVKKHPTFHNYLQLNIVLKLNSSFFSITIIEMIPVVYFQMPGGSELTIFWIIFDTDPLNIALNTFTMPTRQPHSNSIEIESVIKPTPQSGRSNDSNRNLPLYQTKY